MNDEYIMELGVQYDENICAGCAAHVDKEFWSENHEEIVCIEKYCVMRIKGANGENLIASYPLEFGEIPSHCIRKMEYMVMGHKNEL